MSGLVVVVCVLGGGGRGTALFSLNVLGESVNDGFVYVS